MARVSILPDVKVLQRWVTEEGLTHQQCAERVEADTGHQVSRAAISVALHRAGLTQEKPRYSREIPWPLTGRALHAYPVRMLRLLARQRRELPLSEEEARRLSQWLTKVNEYGAVVAWDPDTDEQLFYVAREDGDDPDIPVRRQRVYTKK